MNDGHSAQPDFLAQTYWVLLLGIGSSVKRKSNSFVSVIRLMRSAWRWKWVADRLYSFSDASSCSSFGSELIMASLSGQSLSKTAKLSATFVYFLSFVKRNAKD